MRLRVLHVVPGFFPALRYGGPIESVLGLCRSLRATVEVEVMTTDANGSASLAVPLGELVEVAGVPVRYFRCRRATGTAFSVDLVQALRGAIPRFDLVHVTGCFSILSTAPCLIARNAGVPYVVSPRGSCRRWGLSQKRWKKLPYWHLVERANLIRAGGVHTTSEVERAELAEIAPEVRSFVVPNGVTLPEGASGVERAANRVLFLGRLHRVKALDNLVRALSIVQRQLPNIETVFAGPDDSGEWARVETIMATLSPRPRVTYVGSVAGSKKAELLAASTLLVLPSHTENFGQVVVEALAAATPVVASRHTPWQVLEQRRAGLWVDNDPESLAEALLRVLRDPSAARAMGAAGEALAREFTWPAIAAEMRHHYERIVAAGRG